MSDTITTTAADLAPAPTTQAAFDFGYPAGYVPPPVGAFTNPANVGDYTLVDADVIARLPEDVRGAVERYAAQKYSHRAW